MEEGFETPVDFSKLPPNYHDEEKEERRVGNATVYSHREINKVSSESGQGDDAWAPLPMDWGPALGADFAPQSL